MTDKVIKKLTKNIEESNKNKSSHWQKYLKRNNDYLNEFANLGFGSYTKKSFKNILQNFFLKIIFGKQIFKTDTYKKYKSIFDKNNRFIDIDTIRHIFTFEKLKKLVDPEIICIIGDGKLNGVIGAHITFPRAKIFNVNLSEVLINDYLLIKELDINLKNSTELIDHLNFHISNSKVYLVPSNLKNFLLNKKIDLFINIASFQEMNLNEINKYFKIILNNKSKLYCCNREHKKLIGGENVYFDKYPWLNPKIFFWENCPWHQKYYSKSFPFIKNYEGNVKHCLVDFSFS